jgi:hypothetical protein
MKKLFVLALGVVALTFAFYACSSDSPVSSSDVALQPAAKTGDGLNGNGAPSGAHFNLNIIGVPQEKENMPEGLGGHVIFVNLWSKGQPDKIMLIEGEEFAVLDKNGTDGRAEFQLPNPDPNCDGVTDYSVFVRARGTPGGSAKIQSCYEIVGDTGEIETYCAADYLGGVEPITVGRCKGCIGEKKFDNVSKDLLYVDMMVCLEWGVDDAGEAICLIQEVVQVPLFGEDVEGYLWEYDNYGLKNCQMRFYPDYSTTVPDGYNVNCDGDPIDPTPSG